MRWPLNSALSTRMIRSRAITACATARAAPSSPWRSGTTGRGSCALRGGRAGRPLFGVDLVLPRADRLRDLCRRGRARRALARRGARHRPQQRRLRPAPRPSVLPPTSPTLWTAARDWLAAAGELATQALADKAANFAERFAALEKQAEEQRTLERSRCWRPGAPSMRRWKPVIAAASEAKAALKQALEPFLRAERDRLEAGRAAAGPSRRAPAPPGRRIGLRAVRQRAGHRPRRVRGRLPRRCAGSGPATTSTRCCCGWPRTIWPPGGPSPAPSSSKTHVAA